MRSARRLFVLAKSKSAKADEGSFAWQLSLQRGEWESMTAGLPYPLCITFLFRRASKRAFDYVNIAQGLLDAMVAAEYIPDDSADYVIPVFVPYVISKRSPGCDIGIAT